MDLRKLKTILELFENSGIQEMELTEDKETIRLAKGPSGAVTVSPPPPPPQAPAPAAVPAPAPAAAPAAPAAPAAEPPPPAAAAEGLVELKAPMVGTFYTRPNPEEPLFVTPGGHVSEGDSVCMIEAMKMFNTLKAPVSGKVVSVNVQNEQAVGYGDVLMVFEPDAS